MTQLSRRHLLAGAAATAAVAAMPVAAAIAAVVETAPVSIDEWIEANIHWPTTSVDRQTFFDGRVDWTFYARRREWIGIDRHPERPVAELIDAMTGKRKETA